MLQKNYETPRLILLQSAPSLAAKTADYYSRNRDFFENIDPPRPPDFYTIKAQRRGLQRDLQDAKKMHALRFWLMLKGSDEIIGMTALNNIVFGSFCSCFLAYKLDLRFLRQGLTSEAISRVVRIAFDDLGLHRIEANIMPRNIPSLRLVEKLGFQNEGLARQYLNINDVWEDHIHMTLLNQQEIVI